MSNRRRRRPRRNIWSEPPSEAPFDYDEPRFAEPAEETEIPAVPEPGGEVEGSADNGSPRGAAVAPGKHLRPRRLVLPAGSRRRGKHSTGPLEENDRVPEPGVAVEPEDVTAGPEAEEVTAAPAEEVALDRPDEPAIAELEEVEPAREETPDVSTEYRGKHLTGDRRLRFPRPTRRGKHSVAAGPAPVREEPISPAPDHRDEAPLEELPSEVDPDAGPQGLDEEIPPFEPPASPSRRRRRRRHRSRGGLLPPKSPPGRRSLSRPAQVEQAAEEEWMPEPVVEPELDTEPELVADAEVDLAPEPEIDTEPELVVETTAADIEEPVGERMYLEPELVADAIAAEVVESSSADADVVDIKEPDIELF
ncbi:MAG: hypothetical protein M3238_04730 [Actinomycetota bacterium]|nr:hypothetical protein [Actinomycetota bacterium]